jgi:hypothetical protein
MIILGVMKVQCIVDSIATSYSLIVIGNWCDFLCMVLQHVHN